MPAGRVLATQQAKEAAKQLLVLTGPVKEQVGRVLQHGGILADPHHWEGGLAGRWRDEWGSDASHLRQTAVKLDELGHRAQQVVEDIIKADGSLGAPPEFYEPPGQPGGSKFVLGDPAKPPLKWDEDFPYDPNAEPTLDDRLAWLRWEAKLKGADVIRPDLDDALAAYRHYRDGNGDPLTVDYEEAYREDPVIRKIVDSEIASARQAAERLATESNLTSFKLTGDATPSGELGGYPSTENWQKTLGAHQVWSSADVQVHDGKVTMKVVVNAEDRYNFNKGDADIATGTPDEENGRFSQLGWARSFDTHGTVVRTITWNIGDPSAPSVDETDSPQRNPGREDREDSRGSADGGRPVVPDNNRDSGESRAR